MDKNQILGAIDRHMDDYKKGTIKIADLYDFDTYKLVQQITLYIMSKYTGGQTDPITKKRLRFKNIGNGIVDIEFRAKNIDQKAIVATAVDGDTTFSMIVNRELQNWMRNNFFGETIDKYQRKKSEYGNVLLKKTILRDRDNKRTLRIEPVSWSSAFFDVRDVGEGMKIEVDTLSEMEFQKKSSTWLAGPTEETLNRYRSNRTIAKGIQIFDVEGEFPKKYFTGDDKEKGVALYNLIVADVNGAREIVYHAEIEESAYLYDGRKEVEGRGWRMGVWEEILEPQIATNEAVIAEADAMDLAGKVVIKTNKKSNIPSALSIVNGEMIELEDGEFMDVMSLTPGALPLWGKVMDDWFVNMQRDQSAYSSVAGGDQKANTPFASLALQSAQAGSIFNKRRDHDGYFLSKVIMQWVLPFLIENINKEHELIGAYSPMELKVIDKAIKDTVVEKYKLDTLLEGGIPDEATINGLAAGVDNELSVMGATRKLNIPKGYITLDKIKKKVRFDITGEMSDSQAELNALATRLQSLPPEDPARRQIIDQISEVAGISPMSFYSKEKTPSTAGGAVNAASQQTAQRPSKVTALLPKAQQ